MVYFQLVQLLLTSGSNYRSGRRHWGNFISDADKEKATFTAPETPGEYVFKLTVTGPNVSSTSTTTVTILVQTVHKQILIVSVNAGPDQTGIKQGTVVTLDGSGSQNATSYSWKQVSGQTVTLNGANTAKPTFTFPKQPEPVEFELTVTGPDGKTASKTVKISTVNDNLSRYCRRIPKP